MATTADQQMAKEIVIAWIEYIGETKSSSLIDPNKAGESISIVFKAAIQVINETFNT